MAFLKNETGNRYVRLVILRRATRNKRTSAVWECRCDCGERLFVPGDQLRSGNTKSCGCLKIDSIRTRNTKHGQARRGAITREYRIWEAMWERCTNKNSIRFCDYGGRGISVCERWRKFELFFKDMGSCPTGHSIDRRNNDENYEPGNCRWATYTEQMNNRSNNIHVQFDGREMTIGQLAHETSIPYQRLHYRIRRGCSAADAVTLSRGKLYARAAR